MSVKVLHLINNLGSGGAEKLLEDLIPLMNKMENIEADILLLTDKNNVFYNSLINKGIKVDVVKLKNMYDLRNIFEIRKHIINGKYDIVHSHTFPTQMWAALSKVFLSNKKVKFITTEHSTHNRRREKYYFRFVDKLIYSQYDSIISITEKTRDNLINWIDPKRKKVEKHVIIENGVDIEKIKEALPYKKNELIEGASENIKLVCMVGRFSEAKDQPTLIRAISKLPEEIHLVLIGEGPLISNSIDLVHELGMSNRVHFLGFRVDVNKILKTIDILVLSSLWEGFGLAAVEGMAAGKPVIVSNVDGLKEVVYGAGLIFMDEKDLKNKINKMFSDKSLYEEISKKCIVRAEFYNINRMKDELRNIYL